MKRTQALAMFGVGLVVAGCGDVDDGGVDRVTGALSAGNAADRAALALHWAPVHRQDTDVTDINSGTHSLNGRSDFVTRFDYDGDWIGRNNWDNASRFAFPAYAYSSVVETTTHWYVVYMFFHARDWTDIPFDQEHENDSEGLLAIVARDGSPYGALQAIVTVAHTDFFSYVPAGSPLAANHESIDGTLNFQSYGGSNHPITAQESKGHGLRVPPDVDINGDGVVYFPSATTAEVPDSADDRSVLYKLEDIFAAGGLWSRRNDAATFASVGTFAGDTGGGCGDGWPTCSTNSANAPWGWDDHDDGPARGALAVDPAGLAANYFVMPAPFASAYTYNPYVGIGP